MATVTSATVNNPVAPVTINTSPNPTFIQSLAQNLSSGLTSSKVVVVTSPSATIPSGSVGLLSIAAAPTNPIILGSGIAALVNTASGSVTVAGNQGSNHSILSSTGNLTYYSAANESGTILATTGNNLFTAPTVNGGNWTLVLDGLSGANTVVAGAAKAVIEDAPGQKNIMFLGSGADTVGAFGADTLVGGGGNDTVFFNGSNNVLFGGSASSSSMVVVTAPSVSGSTYVAGSGDSTVFALDGSSGTYSVGSGNFEFVGTSGSSSTIDGSYGASTTATVFGSSNANIVLNSNAIGNILVAAGANTTLNASGSAGANILFNEVGAGSSATLIGGSYWNYFIAGAGSATMEGGAGHNFFQFVSGQDGGTNLITNWNADDQIDLMGYTSSQVQETVSGGSTVITLSDGTKITVQNVTNLPSSDIKIG